MTELLEQAIMAAKQLPPEIQDEIAHLVLQMADNASDIYQTTAEEEAEIDKALAEAERGELATEEAVEAMWAKYRR